MRILFIALLFGYGLSLDLAAQIRAVPSAPSLSERGELVAMVPAYAPGKTYRFVSHNVVRMQLPAQGIREAVVEQQIRLDASPRPDGRAGVALKCRIERLKADFRTGEDQVVYDSFNEQDRSSTLGQHFRDALNRWITLTMSPGLKILSSSAGGRTGSGTKLPGVPQFGIEEMEKLVAEIPQGLPDGRVYPGSSWTVNGERELDGLGSVNFDIKYHYTGDTVYDGHACHEVQVQGKLGGDALIADNVGALSGGRMFFEGTSLSGRLLFDPAEGTVRLREQSLSMLMELPARDGAEPFQIPVQQEASIRLLHVVPTS
ncbi:MAG: hypothetical protein P1U68_14645 [Verrucomicrobiales bacterium]|nr:hypothetical protein [Verrucomicrobiales bacterium]